MTRERARRQGSKEAGEQADKGGKGIGGQVECGGGNVYHNVNGCHIYR